VTVPSSRAGGAGLAAGLRRAARAQRIELELGPAVPGWVLRVLLGGGAGLLVALSGAVDLPVGPARWFGWVALVALVVVAGTGVVRPGGVAAGVLVVGVGLFALRAPAGVTARTFLLILLIHVLLRLSAVAAHAGWRARVELAVLGVQAREAAVVQVGVQLLALAAASVPPMTSAGAAGAGIGAWVRAGVAGGVLALVVLLVPRTWFVRRR
jgi:hypothetical protein